MTTPPLVRAGTLAEALAPTGDWVFVDVGFAARNATTGWLQTSAPAWEGEAENRSFGATERALVALVGVPSAPLHVVLEAPLTGAFGSHGPVGRRGDKSADGKARYWYTQPATTVLVASIRLLQSLAVAERAREVRIFEGFVSFKSREGRSDHRADVCLLRDWVRTQSHVADVGTTDASHTLWSVLTLVGIAGNAHPPIIGGAGA